LAAVLAGQVLCSEVPVHEHSAPVAEHDLDRVACGGAPTNTGIGINLDMSRPGAICVDAPRSHCPCKARRRGLPIRRLLGRCRGARTCGSHAIRPLHQQSTADGPVNGVALDYGGCFTNSAIADQTKHPRDMSYCKTSSHVRTLALVLCVLSSRASRRFHVALDGRGSLVSC
jgi:hypothetical protein